MEKMKIFFCVVNCLVLLAKIGFALRISTSNCMLTKRFWVPKGFGVFLDLPLFGACGYK